MVGDGEEGYLTRIAKDVRLLDTEAMPLSAELAEADDATNTVLRGLQRAANVPCASSLSVLLDVRVRCVDNGLAGGELS